MRALGLLEQGLLAGVEHLGRGERSSSDIDIHGPEHIRFAPDPFHVTMPLMSFVTELGSVAMNWTETSLQPTFAAPNFVDGTPDHRMSLRGRSIEASIHFGGSFADGAQIGRRGPLVFGAARIA